MVYLRGEGAFPAVFTTENSIRPEKTHTFRAQNLLGVRPGKAQTRIHVRSSTLTEVQRVHVVVADGRVPASEHVDLPLLHHARRVTGGGATERGGGGQLRGKEATPVCASLDLFFFPSYPERGEGLFPVTMGWYQMERCGSKM